MSAYSKMAKDLITPSAQTAAWWIEYVGRNGALIEPAPLQELHWTQVYLLDVLLLMFSVITFFLLLLVCSLCICYRKWRGKKEKSE